MKDLRRDCIIEAAGHYLSDQEDLFPDLYEAYIKLVEKCEEGYGNSMADCFVNVWEQLEDDMTVKDLADLIEGGADNLEKMIKNLTTPNPALDLIKGIDWSKLRNQKRDLLTAMSRICNDGEVDGLTGILHLIDAIQDCAVDQLKIVEEKDAYDTEDEDGIMAVDIENYVDEWGQTHDEICYNLEYNKEDSGADEMILGDGYFWLERFQKWFPKSSSLYSEMENKIVEHIQSIYS